MNPPLGFFLTFRTYGTWLHGHPDGSVDDEHNVFGTPFVVPNSRRAGWEAARMGDEPMILNHAMREVAEAAIRDECAFHKWDLIEVGVRSNHVHIVIAFAGVRPEWMAQRLKSRVTRWLRQRGLVADRPVWADGPGSRKYLWTEQDVADAALYVREYQDEPRSSEPRPPRTGP